MSKVALNSLSDYNNGVLIYKWFDLTDYTTHDEYLEAVHEWLEEVTNEQNDGEVREEWIMGDAEGVPSKYLGTYDLDSDFWEYLEAVNEHGEDIVNAAVACDIPLDKINDAYAGSADSDEAFAEQLCDDTGMLDSLPDNLRSYFDMEKFARDLMFEYCDDNGHYFSNNW